MITLFVLSTICWFMLFNIFEILSKINIRNILVISIIIIIIHGILMLDNYYILQNYIVKHFSSFFRYGDNGCFKANIAVRVSFHFWK